MSEELDLAHRVAHAVRDAGGRAFIVGGWVRDDLLHRGSNGGASAGRVSGLYPAT
jgi:tRNA nucleotidyltransferase/poly(A) polymerase